MAPVGMSNGHMNGTTATTTTTTRHAAHDSALDVGSKEDEDTRMRDLEEENEMLVERVTAAGRLGEFSIFLPENILSRISTATASYGLPFCFHPSTSKREEGEL